MPMPGKRAGILPVLCAAAMAVFGTGTAWAAAEPIEAFNEFEFNQPTYTMDQGDQPVFNNNEPGELHDVTATGRLGGKPLFLSRNVLGVGSGPVNGAQYLTQGIYQFFCDFHPISMRAQLAVSANGTPVARPRIMVKLLSSKLKPVRNGKVRVRIRAFTGSADAVLTVKKGARLLARRGNIDLAAGQVRTLVLSIPRARRGPLKGVKQARVKLTGSVPFGRTVSASKLLR